MTIQTNKPTPITDALSITDDAIATLMSRHSNINVYDQTTEAKHTPYKQALYNKAPHILMISTTTCYRCRMAKRHFAKLGIVPITLIADQPDQPDQPENNTANTLILNHLENHYDFDQAPTIFAFNLNENNDTTIMWSGFRDDLQKDIATLFNQAVRSYLVNDRDGFLETLNLTEDNTRTMNDKDLVNAMIQQINRESLSLDL